MAASAGFGVSGGSSSPFSSIGGVTTPDISNLNTQASSAFAIGAKNGAANDALNALPKRNMPWDLKNSAVKSQFFHYIDLSPSRWDQLFPYRLAVIDTSKNNAIVNGSAGNLSVFATVGTGTATVYYETIDKAWIYTLPITPQQLHITDVYAINTTATLRGIVEEHGGLKFKNIMASGTFGVWPTRESLTQPPGSPSILQSLFGGTISAFNNLVSKATSVINAITSDSPNAPPIKKRPTGTQGFETGYFKALELEQFLEQYAEAKKNPKNASWRLVFDIPKQNQSFVVTPQQFVWQQNVNKAMEINFTLQLKAWRRVALNSRVTDVPAKNQAISPGILQRILTVLRTARQTTSAASNLVSAVTTDVEAPLAVLQQTSLLVKDIGGVALSVADLPAAVQKAYASGIASAIANIGGAFSTLTTNPAAIAAAAAITAAVIASEGLSTAAVANGQIGNVAANALASNPALNPLNNPTANFALLDAVPLSSLNLTPQQQAQVNAIIAANNQLKVADLKNFRTTILTLANQLTNSYGAGDAFYSKVYGLPPPITRSQPMTLDEFDFVKGLYDVVQGYDILTASNFLDIANTETSLEYVAGLAANAGIPFTTPTSQILAPVPFGLTIEAIALRYLGDAQRWIEIATLNNLREPYIDENGFQLPLLSNATGRQITIADITYVYLGQSVLLKSGNQIPVTRNVIGIDKLSSTSYLITLDGLPNLNNFTLINNAYLQVYLPGTTNSQHNIYIPSDLPVDTDAGISIPASLSSETLVQLGLVDLMLTDEGDIATNTYGDFVYSAGLSNIMQALKIKIGSAQGTIITHPGFGLGVRPGQMNVDTKAQDIFNNINQMILEDSRFQGINTLQVTLNGPTLSLSLGVGLAGTNGVLPVAFNLPNQ